MEKRTVLALVLSFLVIGFYPVLLKKFYPEHYKKTYRSETQASKPLASSSPASAAPVSAKLTAQGTFLEAHDHAFKNSQLHLVFNEKDGGIRDISFPRFPDAETSRPLKFLSPKSIGASGFTAHLHSATESVLVSDYAIESGVTDVVMKAESLGGKVRVTKKMQFGEAYDGALEVSFENISNSPLEFAVEMVAGSGVNVRNNIDPQYIEANFFQSQPSKKLKHIKEHRAGKEVKSESFLDWVAVKDRHFSVILRPKKTGSSTGLVRGLGSNDFSASLVSEKITLSPGATLTQSYDWYIGPNEIDRLEPLGLGDLVNFGKFDVIGKLLVGGLELIHKIFRNYGLAIIALTLLINVLLFPFTRQSYMSMKRMQLVQPQMSKLREQHKNNPEKLNREMMELYRKHKVNPFGGCLPMLMQIPIFISLYVALSKSVSLINAKLLWIKDLSAPDRIYLPFSLPFAGNFFHLLPLLMVGAMVIQQRFTQIKMANQDPAMEMQQKMMAVTMPIVFGFIFYQMPSGLVLYWLTNTLLTSAYQYKLKNMTLA